MSQPDPYYSSYSDTNDSYEHKTPRKRSHDVSSDEESSPSAKKTNLGDSLEENSIESTSADEQETEEARPSFNQFQDSVEEPPEPTNDVERSSMKRKSSPIPSSLMDNSKIMKMMSKMDYKEGQGLGKHGQGRQAPVEASKHKGRRGLGFEHKELQEANYKFDPTVEVVEIREKIDWISNSHNEPPNFEDLQEWMTLGPYKKTIDDETDFCDVAIVKDIMASKSVFDKLDKIEMRDARTRSNPFETIRGNIFLNRAAVKMANIDKACDMMFTNSEPDSGELLYFADVCAGPGGFSEYVLWRKKWQAKGFGFTLKRSCDFKLEDFHAGPCETFHPYYGPSDDINKQGDVFLPENQEALLDLVMQHTNGRGVHFMMSDGGFSVEGEENIQEILSKQLYLCQCLVALMIVREGGHFVTKLFDLFTPFSAGLVYLMYRCFHSVSIFKPNTSRPANSERYLICQGKRGDISAVIEYLKEANMKLLRKDKNKDIVELVPMDILREDEEFFDYLKSSNEELGKNQITGLLKIAAYAEDKTLIEMRQKTVSQECLEYWGLPNTTRTAPKRVQPDEMIRQLGMQNALAKSQEKCEKLTKDTAKKVFNNLPYNWFFVPCEYGNGDPEKKMPTFYLGLGRSKIYEYQSGAWVAATRLNIELPPKTLVYGEIVQEYEKEWRKQLHLSVLHIIDALVLGGKDISNRDLISRHKLIKQFCKALYKPDHNAPVQVRAKDLLPLDKDLLNKLRLKERHMKSNDPYRMGYDLPKTSLNDSRDDEEPCFFLPKSIMFLRFTKDSWNRCLSRKYDQIYLCKGPQNSIYETDMKDSHHTATFSETFEKRVLWYWPQNDSFSERDFLKYIGPHLWVQDVKESNSS